MALKKVKKQPWERLTIAGEFSNVLTDGETISAPPASMITAVTSENINVSDSFLDQDTIEVDGNYLKIRCLEGVQGEVYSINFRIETSLGNRWETDMQITVKEVGSIVVTTTTV